MGDGLTATDAPIGDYFTDPATAHDNAAYAAALRRRCPVLREPHHGVYMITGYDAATEVLTNRNGAFSSAISVTGPIPPLPFAPQGEDIRAQLDAHRPQMPWTDHLATFDGAHHTAHRALLAQLLTHSRLKKNEDYVAGLVVRLVDDLIDRGQAEITRDFAHALSTLVIADLLGVPEDEREELITCWACHPPRWAVTRNSRSCPIRSNGCTAVSRAICWTGRPTRRTIC